jgi:hypothetical protein
LIRRVVPGLSASHFTFAITLDAHLVPFMIGMLAALMVGMGYVSFSAWRSQRAVALNVVNAALTLWHLSPDQAALFQQGLAATLQSLHMTPETPERAGPGVKLAVYAESMRRQQIAPHGTDRPFKALRSPLLARSAAAQIKFARIQAEMTHSVALTELDEFQAAATDPGKQAMTGR